MKNSKKVRIDEKEQGRLIFGKINEKLQSVQLKLDLNKTKLMASQKIASCETGLTVDCIIQQLLY